MKKLVSRIVMVLAAVCLISMVGCSKEGGASSANESGEKKIKLRYSTVVSKNEIDANKTPMAIGINTWIKTVEEQSNGTIEVMLFPDGQIASKTDQVVNGIQTGGFEVASFATGNWAEFTNAFAELNVPYLLEDVNQVGTLLHSDISDSMIVQLESDVSGVKGLAFLNIGFREMTNSKREIRTPADLKGLKIRTMNDKLQIATLEALGANAAPLAISELYGALQQHLVDGQENPLSTINSQKFYEVNKYCTLTNHSYTTTFLFMSRKAWDGLSENQKAAVEAADKASMENSLAAVKSAEDEYIKILTDVGMTVYKPTKEEMKQFRDLASTSWGAAEKLMGEARYTKLMDTLGI